MNKLLSKKAIIAMVLMILVVSAAISLSLMYKPINGTITASVDETTIISPSVSNGAARKTNETTFKIVFGEGIAEVVVNVKAEDWIWPFIDNVKVSTNVIRGENIKVSVIGKMHWSSGTYQNFEATIVGTGNTEIKCEKPQVWACDHITYSVIATYETETIRYDNLKLNF